jgi:hypothetical protein
MLATTADALLAVADTVTAPPDTPTLGFAALAVTVSAPTPADTEADVVKEDPDVKAPVSEELTLVGGSVNTQLVFPPLFVECVPA